MSGQVISPSLSSLTSTCLIITHGKSVRDSSLVRVLSRQLEGRVSECSEETFSNSALERRENTRHDETLLLSN